MRVFIIWPFGRFVISTSRRYGRSSRADEWSPSAKYSNEDENLKTDSDCKFSLRNSDELIYISGYKDEAIAFANDLDDDGAYEIHPPRAANKSLIRINAGFGVLEFPLDFFLLLFNISKFAILRCVTCSLAMFYFCTPNSWPFILIHDVSDYNLIFYFVVFKLMFFEPD